MRFTTFPRARIARIGAVLVLLASSAAAQEVRQQARQTMTDSIAAQLGARLSPHQPDELAIGMSLTATLTDPARIATFGATGLHAGARVTILRIAPEKLRVEVDEMDPVPLTKKLTVRIDAAGRLTPLAP